MRKIIVVFVALFIVFGALGINKYRANKAVVDNNTLRKPAAGAVIGFVDKHSTYAWLGIPFAKPPLGDLRWRAPRALTPWQGTRTALTLSEPCAQLHVLALLNEHAVTGSEDCLYLNVWTPQLTAEQVAQQRLPVMVWIHGGGNTLSSGGSSLGHHLAGEQQVVVVTLQYRLGVFGWLSHPALRNAAMANPDSTPADASSNFGLLDLIAGLHWVHDNIAAFGGDPQNVTIFGQSAGGQDVYALLAAPPAKGLFQRAIVESGVLRTRPIGAAENYSDDSEPGLAYSTREYINKLLVADHLAIDRASAKIYQQRMSDTEIVDYLRSHSAQQLLSVVKRRSFGMYFTPTIIRDGYVVPRAPLREIFSDPTQYNSVPLLIGNNRDEYKLFMMSNPDLTEKRFGFIPKIKNLETFNRITGYFSDAWKAQAVDEVAAILQRSQGDTVFTYRLDWDEEPDYGIVNLHDLLGASHGIDTEFVFGDGAARGLPFLRSKQNVAGRTALTDAMMSYWANFAKHGVPGNGGQTALPAWQPWSATEPSLMVFNTKDNGGIHLSAERMHIADIKQRLREDNTIDSYRRCELYVQIFYLGLSDDYWDGDEYNAWGCSKYPRQQFHTVF